MLAMSKTESGTTLRTTKLFERVQMTSFLAFRHKKLSPLLGEERCVSKCGKQRSVGGRGESVAPGARRKEESAALGVGGKSESE